MLDDEGEGWFQSNVMQSEVLYAYDAVSTPTGRVGLKIGRIPIEGYQTDAGLRLEGRDPQSDAYVGMIATQSDFPLSVVDGVYDVRVETRYHGKNYVGQAMPWQGTVAVVGTADSLKLNLKLSNSQGGNAGAFIQTRNLGERSLRLEARRRQEGGRRAALAMAAFPSTGMMNEMAARTSTGKRKGDGAREATTAQTDDGVRDNCWQSCCTR